MSEQYKLKKSAVLGEDGELLQPDMTVDPEAYAEFVATHVCRDPLLFRMREHIREHRAIYLFLVMASLCIASRLIEDLFSKPEQLGNDVLAIIMSIIGVTIGARLLYTILQIDTRQ